jgi:hypothetical protein
MLLLLPSLALADSFSLFGARFGSSREEIARIWTPVGDGGWTVPDSPIRQVTTLFDHRGRLVRVTFTLDLPLSDPPEMVGKAIQMLVDRRWSGDPELGTTTIAGRFENQVTVWNKKLVDEYVRHLEEQVSSLLKP